MTTCKFIALITLLVSPLSAQTFQTPPDLQIGHGNPFDDPNFSSGSESPAGICGDTFPIRRDVRGAVTECSPFKSSDAIACEANYIGSIQTIDIVEDSNEGLQKQIKSLNSRLKTCKSSRGRRC